MVNPQNESWILFTILLKSLYRGSLYQGLNVLFRSFFESQWTTYDDSHWQVSSDWSNNKGSWKDSDGNTIAKPSFTNWFLIGVKSVHSNSKEDRKFKFFYARTTKYILANCKTTSTSSYGSTLAVPSQLESLNWGKKYLIRLINFGQEKIQHSC